jgi:hypothetical protein
VLAPARDGMTWQDRQGAVRALDTAASVLNTYDRAHGTTWLSK